MDKNKQAQYMIRRIGGTTYKEVVTNDGTCDIIGVPQMSRQSERSAS